MGIERQQVQVHIDFDTHEIEFLVRRHLEIKPRSFKIHFAILKGIMHQILKDEAEREIDLLLAVGDEVTKQQEAKAQEPVANGNHDV